MQDVPAFRASIFKKFVASIGKFTSAARADSRSSELEAVSASFRTRATYFAQRTPLVSIVISVSSYRATMRCLRSIADVPLESFSSEIILVGDALNDDSARELKRIPGILTIDDVSDVGLARSRNDAVARARAPFVCFLDDGVVVTGGWLERLVDTIEREPYVDAVGSKVVYSDGRLREAGTIVWRDASTSSYGRFDNPIAPQYEFQRDVDCCSGVSLLVRRQFLVESAGFDPRFASASYGTADVCMGIRRCERRVVYQPASVVVHVENDSPDANVTRDSTSGSTVDLDAFEDKWRDALVREHADARVGSHYAAARRLGGSPRVLVIDSSVPKYDYDSGSLRLTHILKLLVETGARTVFFPVLLEPLQPYTSELQQIGVEVLVKTTDADDVESYLGEVLSATDIVWICRPELAQRFFPLLRRFANVKIVYDTIDLHFVRERRQAEVTDRSDVPDWGILRMRELECARRADLTITVTDVERDVLEGFGIGPVAVVPNVHAPKALKILPFDRTEDLLFIGGYAHPPNVDAVRWLVSEIMPLIWERLPHVRVTLLGSNPPASVRALAGPNVAVPGFISDVDPFFRTHRVFVAPLRYGAGLKGKIGEALSYGIPTVVTPIAAEGYAFLDETDALIASDAPSFAKAIIRLYLERTLWEGVSRRSIAKVESLSPDAVRKILKTLLRDALPALSSGSNEAAADNGVAPRRVIVASSFRAGVSYCVETLSGYLDLMPCAIEFDRYAEHNINQEMLAQFRGIDFVTDFQMRPHSKNLIGCRDASIGIAVLWRNLADAVVSFDKNTGRFGANNPIFYVDHQALVAMSSQRRYRYIIDSIVGWSLGFYLNWRRIPDTVLYPYELLLADSFGFFKSMLHDLGFLVDDNRLQSIVIESNTNLHVDVVPLDSPLDEINRRHLERLVLDHPEADQLEVLLWELPWEPLEIARISPHDGRLVHGTDGDGCVYFVSRGIRRKVDASWIASRSPRLGLPTLISDDTLNDLPRAGDLY